MVNTEEWLARIYTAGREPKDALMAIDALDRITNMHSSPTCGWIERFTQIAGP